MNFFVAVTDNDWFRYLSALSDADEVNFWQLSRRVLFSVLGDANFYDPREDAGG